MVESTYRPRPSLHIRPHQTLHIGDVILPRLGRRAIPVYKVAASSRGFHLPYIAYNPADLENLQQRKCGDSADAAGNFPLIFIIETSTEDVMREAEEKYSEFETVSMYPYKSLRLFDSGTGRTLWQDPEITREGSFITSGYNSTPVRGKDISCDDLLRYIETPGELAAEVTILSAVQSTNSARLSYGWFRDFALDLTLDRIEEQAGGIGITGRDDVRGRARSSGLGGGFFSGLTGGLFSGLTGGLFSGLTGGLLGGTNRASLVTDTESSETDSRTRYINVDALRSVTKIAGVQIRAEGYCSLNDVGERDCDSSALIDRLFEKLASELPTREFAILFDEPDDDAYENYILIERPETVDRLRNHSFNPSFTNSITGALDCQAIAASAGVPPAGAVASSTSGSTPPTTQSAPGNNPWEGSPRATTPGQPSTPTLPPGNTGSPQGGDCGVGQDISISDKNEIEWKYSGREWVPTSIVLRYLNEDSFSGKAGSAIYETVGSGYGVFVTRHIPVIQKNNDVVLRSEVLSEHIIDRLTALENRTPKISPIFRRFLSFNSWGDNSVAGDDILYWWIGENRSLQGVRNKIYNSGNDTDHSSPSVNLGGTNFRAIKIPLPKGYDRTNSLCTISGIAGAWNGAGEIAFIHVHRTNYYVAGLHRAGNGGIVLIECFAIKTVDGG